MKKFLLSALVIVGFTIYAFWQRNYNPVLTPVVATIPAPAPKVKVTTPTPSVATVPPPASAGAYRDGSYLGSVADAYYGQMQVRAIISGGRITDVQFLNYPQDRNTSVRISNRALPLLRSEALQSQNAQVDIVSGATQTSGAFRESLAAALAQA